MSEGTRVNGLFCRSMHTGSSKTGWYVSTSAKYEGAVQLTEQVNLTCWSQVTCLALVPESPRWLQSFLVPYSHSDLPQLRFSVKSHTQTCYVLGIIEKWNNDVYFMLISWKLPGPSKFQIWKLIYFCQIFICFWIISRQHAKNCTLWTDAILLRNQPNSDICMDCYQKNTICSYDDEAGFDPNSMLQSPYFGCYRKITAFWHCYF